MDPALWLILTLSLAAWAAAAAFGARDRAALPVPVTLLVISLSLWLVSVRWPGDLVQLKSPSAPPWGALTWLYLSMLLGMAAQYFFYRAEPPQPFRWLPFVKPLLASPIVFMPLLGSIQASALDLTRFSLAKLMLLLVAFQNGFFWRLFFETQERRAGRSAAASVRPAEE